MPRIRAEDLASHRARAEADLLAAVGALLEERGPAAVTVAAVAARAGMARSSAYGYAPDRDALLALYARRASEGFAAALAPELAAVDGAPARLDLVVRRLGAELGAELDLDVAPRARAAVHDLLAAVVAEGVAAGTLRPVGPAETVPLVLACLGAERPAVRAGRVDPAAAVDRAASFVRHALVVD